MQQILQEDTHGKVWFQWSCKSNFGMGVLHKFTTYFDNTFLTEHLRTTASVPFVINWFTILINCDHDKSSDAFRINIGSI